eukprot:TRINITY_DN5805_c0_g1_i1.p1 TRINITY_DN5805_c0_g1~~TRINITY_DN5805_c0_g1_i1.p1  ORF type:complete len:982 (+),score=435.18 TRINITY_DN5805_c0_g1_i1:94-3039(+)
MDLDALSRLLHSSISMDAQMRGQATDELARRRLQQGFPAAVLNIVGSPSSEDLRLAAAIYLKNCAKNYWGATCDEVITPQDKQAIKNNVIGVVLDSPSSCRALTETLAECVTYIAESDFPHQWPDLTDELCKRAEAAFTAKQRPELTGIMTLMHSVFVRYRDYAELTEDLVAEIVPIANKVGPCLNAVMGMLCQDLQQPALPAPQAKEIVMLLKTCVQIYHDMICIDLPNYFEDDEDPKGPQRVAEFMNYYLGLMKYHNPALQTTSYDKSPIDDLKATITDVLTLFLNKYDSDFQPYLSAFAEIIWGSSTQVTEDTRLDDSCIAGMDFLAATARSIHHGVFKDDQTLSTVCEQIVIPNIRIRRVDVDSFEDEPEEYIRADIEGSDAHTRRRSACELTNALCKNYQDKVAEIFQRHAMALLNQYQSSGDQERWKAMDCAIYLITALSTKQSVSAIASSGVRGTGCINIPEFFSAHILPELNPNGRAKNPEFPVLKADAIKFVSTFRNQISPDNYVPCVGVLAEWLKCESDVVQTYAASAIEKLLSSKDLQTKVAHVQKSQMGPLIEPCFMNLFQALNTAMRENHYLVQCIMRVIMTAENLVGAYIGPILQPLVGILHQVTKNPNNPAYNHYLFESISALVKHNPAQVPAIEEAIFQPFAQILESDVVEFMPYVFQIFAQLLEIRPDVPQCYAQLLPQLMLPDLYRNKGNVPAVIRLVTVFVEKVPMAFVEQNHLERALGIFAQLAKSKTLDHEGFVLVNALVTSIPYEHLKQYMPKVMMVMCQRLTTAKTIKFCKMMILFCSLFVHMRGADELIQILEAIKPGLWKMMFENVWIQNVGKVTGDNSKKACKIALTKLCCESQLMTTQYSDLWLRGVRATVALLEGDDVVGTVADKEGALYQQLTYQAASLGTKGYDEGYTNAYCPLQCASKPEVDLCRDIADPKQYFEQRWAMVQAMPQFSSMGHTLRQSGMPQNHLRVLRLG